MEPFSPYLDETFLKALFAEAKVLNGIGNPEQWASMLTPAAFQALKERVDIEFAPTNAPFHSPQEAVALEVRLKNTPDLIVKTYEINTLSYFLAQTAQSPDNPKTLNTDLNLDGLVANSESVEKVAIPPLRRETRRFDFPALKGRRGAWVLEFIGGGKSSRALVRKGQWKVVQEGGPAGDLLTVVDEDNKPVAGAVAWYGGRQFLPDAKTGQISIPFTTTPGRHPIILADPAGDFASLAYFEHHAEKYGLQAQFELQREQLVSGKPATVGVRTALLLGSTQVTPKLLEQPKLTILSRSLDGVTTSRDVEDFQLDPTGISLCHFTVPERLASLTVTLQGWHDDRTKRVQPRYWCGSGVPGHPSPAAFESRARPERGCQNRAQIHR